MSNVAIRAEGVSKQYRLGQVGTGTISHDLNRWWHRVRGKGDPYLKIGEANDRTAKGDSEYVWALQDVTFEVRAGEAVGIIGRNGAGKSTLLKILSKVTKPTTGSIGVRGRIASLLEVGTGFHPELSGRENIFLNGAILGMTRSEIKARFDEIVDFAGVERYIDTPVKRYSSGMYVRLAFAVAAFLEPEILIVDEVLAVGDAEFQKKCLGRMKDVSVNEGRTVLFVSHNMDAVVALCTQGILLKNGRVHTQGAVETVVDSYMSVYADHALEKIFPRETAPGNEFGRILSVRVYSDSEDEYQGYFKIYNDVFIELTYLDTNSTNTNNAAVHIKDNRGTVVLATAEFNNSEWKSYHNAEQQIVTATVRLPGNLLAEGKYTVLAALVSYGPDMVHAYLDDLIAFSVIDPLDRHTVKGISSGHWPGIVRPMLEWNIKTAAA